MRPGLLLLLLMPLSTHAAVTINEVAWMGSNESANHEWIELHNSGTSAADLTGWMMTDGMNLTIDLSGTIKAGQYAVLERTSDASAPGSAFLIYTGALVNTGATLELRRADGSLEDQVAGGDDWEQIGGDNTTKETAQYTTSGWITGPATPGRENTNEVDSTATTDDAETEADSTSAPLAPAVAAPQTSGRGQPTYLTLPEVALDLTVNAPRVAYVNQAIDFTVEAGGIGPNLINSLTFDWNFGDTHTAPGEHVTHRFTHPGTYLVTVYGEYKRQAHLGRHEITVLPVAVSLTRNRNGDLQLNNDSPYEIDLSGYTLTGSHALTVPENTIILPNQTITIDSQRIGAPAELHDESGALLLREGGEALPTATPEPLVSAAEPALSAAPEVVRTQSTPPAAPPEEEPSPTPNLITIPAAEAAADAARAPAAPTPTRERWPYPALAILLGVVTLWLLLRDKTEYV